MTKRRAHECEMRGDAIQQMKLGTQWITRYGANQGTPGLERKIVKRMSPVFHPPPRATMRARRGAYACGTKSGVTVRAGSA
eukprot:1062444-Pleurochrysis_carterae.AAC.5